MAVVPETSVPMKLPCTRFSDGPAVIVIPRQILPEMTLRAPAFVPPTVLPCPPREIPATLPRAAVPVTSVPIRFPCTKFPVGSNPEIVMPFPSLPEIKFLASGTVPPIVL